MVERGVFLLSAVLAIVMVMLSLRFDALIALETVKTVVLRRGAR